MGLLKWSVGLILFQILILIFVVESNGYENYADLTNTQNLVNEQIGFDSDDVISWGDLGIFDKLSISFSGLPWWLDLILAIPSILSVLIVILVLRGVSG